jgi:hypothetical protein
LEQLQAGKAAAMTDKGIRQLRLFDFVCDRSKLLPKPKIIQFAYLKALRSKQ